MSTVKGRVVRVLVDPAENNGHSDAVAVLTRVWDQTAPPGAPEVWAVNLRVLYDSPEVGWWTSAELHSTEELARARRDVLVAAGNPAPMVAFWPARD